MYLFILVSLYRTFFNNVSLGFLVVFIITIYTIFIIFTLWGLLIFGLLFPRRLASFLEEVDQHCSKQAGMLSPHYWEICTITLICVRCFICGLLNSLHDRNHLSFKNFQSKIIPKSFPLYPALFLTSIILMLLFLNLNYIDFNYVISSAKYNIIFFNDLRIGDLYIILILILLLVSLANSIAAFFSLFIFYAINIIPQDLLRDKLLSKYIVKGKSSDDAKKHLKLLGILWVGGLHSELLGKNVYLYPYFYFFGSVIQCIVMLILELRFIGFAGITLLLFAYLSYYLIMYQLPYDFPSVIEILRFCRGLFF